MSGQAAAQQILVGGSAPYEVTVGRSLAADRVTELLAGAESVALLHQPSVRDLALQVAGVLRRAGHIVAPLELPDGEAAKELAAAGRAWEHLGRHRVTRSDAVVAVGGGAATDLAGFVAATWLRGVAVVHVPTTLLGMLDAAVGGKTGLNTAAGKNLVGAFHSPRGVVCDLDVLGSLPERELASGAAEAVKCGFIADPQILELLSPGWARDAERLEEIVLRSVRVKAEVVTQDPQEAGLREILNYGHTLGHAIERLEDFTLAHGEAISVGMVFAAEVAHESLGLDHRLVELHRTLLEQLRLPTRYDAEAWLRLREIMSGDKKSRGGTLRMVLLEALAQPRSMPAPPDVVLEAAYRKVCER